MVAEWGVGSREGGVGSGEWGVGSREWGVGSGEWILCLYIVRALRASIEVACWCRVGTPPAFQRRSRGRWRLSINLDGRSRGRWRLSITLDGAVAQKANSPPPSRSDGGGGTDGWGTVQPIRLNLNLHRLRRQPHPHCQKMVTRTEPSCDERSESRYGVGSGEWGVE